MPTHSPQYIKRLARAYMAKIGCSYTHARSHVVDMLERDMLHGDTEAHAEHMALREVRAALRSADKNDD